MPNQVPEDADVYSRPTRATVVAQQPGILRGPMTPPGPKPVVGTWHLCLIDFHCIIFFDSCLEMVRMAPIADCPPGLEYLTQIDQILVHQKVELLESE